MNPDLIELQLAHVERNKIRAAYNRAQRLAERRLLMQQWADFLDGLRESGPPERAAANIVASRASGTYDRPLPLQRAFRAAKDS